MVLTKRNSAKQEQSSPTIKRSFSTLGGGTAAPPKPWDPRAEWVEVSADRLTVKLTDGQVISASIRRFPLLAKATPDQRANYVIAGGGRLIHWPDVDEDISVQGLLRR